MSIFPTCLTLQICLSINLSVTIHFPCSQSQIVTIFCYILSMPILAFDTKDTKMTNIQPQKDYWVITSTQIRVLKLLIKVSGRWILSIN